VVGGPACPKLTNNINYVEATNKNCDVIWVASKAPFVFRNSEFQDYIR
jgi:hypothetical protein